ncbi:nucleotide exchange factor GrpE [Candidatus Woesearchaeota archaeon]|nr:MAG: nucleotide exchange factor GrpE [Candidatus Woesearchaeota archaeon]
MKSEDKKKDIEDIEDQPKKDHPKKENNKKSEVEELKDALKRIQAEFDNYKKRTLKEAEEREKLASKKIITKLLPILDNFELALKNKATDDQFCKGMELIYSELYSLLEAEGLKPIKTEGKFDPYYHEALLSEESDKEEGTNLEELQRGYMLNDEVIRVAKVKVAKKKKKIMEKEESEREENETKKSNRRNERGYE